MVVSACSLLTSVSGLSGGEASPTSDGSSGGDTGVEASNALDATSSADAPTATDAADPRFLAYGNAVLADTPVAYWRFEETALPTARDERGAHHGLYAFSPTLGEPGIAGGRAVRLPAGQRSHVTQADLAFRFPGNQPYAVEVWLQIGKLGGNQWLAGTEGPASPDPRTGWSLFVTDVGGVAYEVWGAPFVDGGSLQRRGIYATSAPFDVARFHHVVMTYNGAVISMWLDGAKRASFTDTTDAPDTGTLMLGCRRTPTGVTACLDDGVLDEVAIYDHPLVEARILAHYVLGKP